MSTGVEVRFVRYIAGWVEASIEGGPTPSFHSKICWSTEGQGTVDSPRFEPIRTGTQTRCALMPTGRQSLRIAGALKLVLFYEWSSCQNSQIAAFIIIEEKYQRITTLIKHRRSAGQPAWMPIENWPHFLAQLREVNKWLAHQDATFHNLKGTIGGDSQSISQLMSSFSASSIFTHT